MSREPTSYYMIDPPGLTEPLEVWLAFLAKMKSLPQENPEVRTEVERAEEMIALIRANPTLFSHD